MSTAIFRTTGHKSMHTGTWFKLCHTPFVCFVLQCHIDYAYLGATGGIVTHDEHEATDAPC